MSPRVILLDIDGTLISCGGAGRSAMVDAVSEHVGRRDVLEFRFGGLTDQLIVRRALDSAGVEASTSRIDDVLDTYLELLPAALDAATDYQVLPGVPALLQALGGQRHVALGLGTGNIEGGARHKLQYGDLWKEFSFGGYGSDHEARDEILRIGAKRGAAQFDEESAPTVFVVGDTPHDVAAAQAIGATCIAVATGGFGADELAAVGAHLVVDDLSDPRALDILLG